MVVADHWVQQSEWKYACRNSKHMSMIEARQCGLLEGQKQLVPVAQRIAHAIFGWSF